MTGETRLGYGSYGGLSAVRAFNDLAQDALPPAGAGDADGPRIAPQGGTPACGGGGRSICRATPAEPGGAPPPLWGNNTDSILGTNCVRRDRDRRPAQRGSHMSGKIDLETGRGDGVANVWIDPNIRTHRNALNKHV